MNALSPLTYRIGAAAKKLGVHRDDLLDSVLIVLVIWVACMFGAIVWLLTQVIE